MSVVFIDCFWAPLATICVTLMIAIIKSAIDQIRKNKSNEYE